MSDPDLAKVFTERITPDNPIFRESSAWPFPDAFVGRLLRDDIPRRSWFGNGQIWAYRDQARQLVGIGTLDYTVEHGQLTENQPHLYIPLLAVDPSQQGRGYGRAIVDHLINEATNLARTGERGEFLYLDVYIASTTAIRLYEKCGFRRVVDQMIEDQEAPGHFYFVMACKLD